MYIIGVSLNSNHINAYCRSSCVSNHCFVDCIRIRDRIANRLTKRALGLSCRRICIPHSIRNFCPRISRERCRVYCSSPKTRCHNPTRCGISRQSLGDIEGRIIYRTRSKRIRRNSTNCNRRGRDGISRHRANAGVHPSTNKGCWQTGLNIIGIPNDVSSSLSRASDSHCIDCWNANCVRVNNGSTCPLRQVHSITRK